MMKYHLEKEYQELIQKEKNMQSRLDVLEKEQKSLNSLVRKSERHISDAYKKA
jgi:phage pi2 protein 07